MKFIPLSSMPLYCKCWAFQMGPPAALSLEVVETVVPLDVPRNGTEISV